jgi:hypothetical protein
MIWIHFNEDKKVREVYVKKYWFMDLDDMAIYMVSRDPCDTTSDIIPIDSSSFASSSYGLSEFFN